MLSKIKPTQNHCKYLALALLVSLAGCQSSATKASEKPEPQSPAPKPASEPRTSKQYDVLANFVASGWMEGCQAGPPSCTWTPSFTTNPHSPPLCVRVSFNPASASWGGIYLQSPANNWGERPGRNMAAYRRLTFWGRAEGEAFVEFKSGGIDKPGAAYRDSYEASLGTVQLTSEWRQYTINLEGSNLSSVIGAFAWVATKAANPKGAVFFLDDVYFED